MYQLVRCSVMIFVGLMKALVLRQPLKSYMWVGIVINTFGQCTSLRKLARSAHWRHPLTHLVRCLLCLLAMILVSWVSFMPEHAEQQPGPWRDPRSVCTNSALR